MKALALLLTAAISGKPAENAFLEAGDHLWVGHGMAEGYGLPFGRKLTLRKVRVLFMQEARVVFEEYPRRFYLRTDFGDSYAFRADPHQTYDFTAQQWRDIESGEITLGMSKAMFLCIKPRSEEIHVQQGPDGPVEQWLYRKEPVALYGDTEKNPPVAVYYFKNDALVAML